MTHTNETPALATNPKIVLFTDWDGTVTLEDSNDYITEHLGFGDKRRKEINDEILVGAKSFRDGFREMLESIDAPFEDCVELLKKEIKLDPGFKDFYVWAKENNVPIVILSGGMRPIIESLLSKLVGEQALDEIQIVSNDVRIHSNGKWEIVYHDDSSFGHDKSLAIRPYASIPKEERPILFYAGDGVSDLSAAAETDLLFAKHGRDLIKYCKTENIPYTEFQSYSDIHKGIQSIYEGKKTLAQLKEN
jgi:2,3-diketo-5-methylthio-1-phosphopentane phosphatase